MDKESRERRNGEEEEGVERTERREKALVKIGHEGAEDEEGGVYGIQERQKGLKDGMRQRESTWNE